MTVLGGIAIYAAGVLTGATMVCYNQWSIRKATAKLQRECNYLREKEREQALQRAWDQGHDYALAERKPRPQTDAERFAETFEGLHTTFKTPKKGKGEKNE